VLDAPHEGGDSTDGDVRSGGGRCIAGRQQDCREAQAPEHESHGSPEERRREGAGSG
jgi:hypothetical protein